MICLLSTVLLGCGGILNTYHNKKADDTISRTIYETVGAKEIYYLGKSEKELHVLHYWYYISKEEDGLADKVVGAVNSVLEQEPTENKIAVRFSEKIPSGTEPLFILRNYIDDYDGEPANYEKLQYLWILGTDLGTQESIYNNPETYKNFPDIRYLRVSPKIQKAADEAGIDWYEYWSELEEVEVYSWGD